MKKFLTLTIIMILIVTALASCGRGSENAGGDTDDTSQGSVQVGVVLPNEDDMRWIQDETIFRTTFENAGIASEVAFSEGRTAVELSNVEDLIDKGMKVLILCTDDVDAAGKAVQNAKDAGATVICYDRLIAGTDAIDYYITFDLFAVGREQGQYLIDKFTGKKGVPLYLYAGKANDSSSLILFSGAWSVLNKAVKNGQFAVQNCPVIADYSGKDLDAKKDREALEKVLQTIDTAWDAETTKKLAEGNLKSKNAKKGELAILAPDDNTARAAADAFSANKEVKSYVVTGQGAETASLKYIQEGKQHMTVRKDTSGLPVIACDMAIKLLSEEKPETNTAYDNGLKEVPSYGVTGTVVDAEGLKQLIADGVYSQEDIDKVK